MERACRAVLLSPPLEQEMLIEVHNRASDYIANKASALLSYNSAWSFALEGNEQLMSSKIKEMRGLEWQAKKHKQAMLSEIYQIRDKHPKFALALEIPLDLLQRISLETSFDERDDALFE
jgi:hypothetical protein